MKIFLTFILSAAFIAFFFNDSPLAKENGVFGNFMAAIGLMYFSWLIACLADVINQKEPEPKKEQPKS